MRKILFATAFLGLVFSSRAQNSLAVFVQAKGDSLLKAERWPGVLIGVLNGGKRQYFSFGYAVPDEKLPFDSSTVFEAGSITKTFTAYIVESILQEKGISDSSSILAYLPDSVRSNKSLADITFLSLLNHTSGLPRLPDNLNLNSKTPYDNYAPDDLFSYLKRCTPQPGGKSHYSNLGAGLAGVLAQRMTGKAYRQLLNDYILQPFAITASESSSYRKAQGYFNNEKAAFWNMAALAPAGGLQCTAGEMLSYLEYIMRPHNAKAKQVVEKLLTPTANVAPTINVGRGWHTLEEKGKPVIYWHNGGTYGFSTFAAFEKAAGKAVVVVVNKFNTNAVSDGLGFLTLKKMLAQ